MSVTSCVTRYVTDSPYVAHVSSTCLLEESYRCILNFCCPVFSGLTVRHIHTMRIYMYVMLLSNFGTKITGSVLPRRWDFTLTTEWYSHPVCFITLL